MFFCMTKNMDVYENNSTIRHGILFNSFSELPISISNIVEIKNNNKAIMATKFK